LGKINKSSLVVDSKCEKNARGSLKSFTERNTTSQTWVIADSLNYIKGYRFELFCIARAAGTSHCCVRRIYQIFCLTRNKKVYCEATPDQVRENNSKLAPEEQWKEDM
jgi:protein KTI12